MELAFGIVLERHYEYLRRPENDRIVTQATESTTQPILQAIETKQPSTQPILQAIETKKSKKTNIFKKSMKRK